MLCTALFLRGLICLSYKFSGLWANSLICATTLGWNVYADS